MNQSVSQNLLNLITQLITFAEYMNLVLYHPEYGYYSSGKVVIGSQGDYFTSSSLSSDFGQLLGQQFIEIWHKLEQPNPFYLVEMGAGNGSLAMDILKYLQQSQVLDIEALDYIIIEASPALRKQQKETLQELINLGIDITWKNWTDIPDNSLIGCLFSNELLDAFPVHRLRVINQELKEIYVTVSEHKIVEVVGELSTPNLLDYFKLVEIDLLSSDYPNNYTTEVNLAALDWLSTVAQKLKQGYVITIDYGYPAVKYYHPQRYQGTLNCYYRHRHHHNPYVNLGEQDLTAHVDFTALEKQGQLLGLETIGVTQQGLFLMALGLGDKLQALSQGNWEISEVMQRRDQLHQLINPTGLGGFQVLTQGKGLSLQGKELTGLKHP
ncbi:MAG: class I SAM-dependent methyltransferase [Xenococcus sp. (in: cyanobacteria)]